MRQFHRLFLWAAFACYAYAASAEQLSLDCDIKAPNGDKLTRTHLDIDGKKAQQVTGGVHNEWDNLDRGKGAMEMHRFFKITKSEIVYGVKFVALGNTAIDRTTINRSTWEYKNYTGQDEKDMRLIFAGKCKISR